LSSVVRHNYLTRSVLAFAVSVGPHYRDPTFLGNPIFHFPVRSGLF
jgi:hypothetical protein